MNNILFGVDVFCTQAAAYKNRRTALVTNNAATTANGTSSRLALLKAGFHIVKLFSPEHGLSARGDDGACQYNHTDELTGLPVISLYSDHLIPSAAELADVDMVLFDIPDVGCRFYTYLWTMTYTMEACALHHIKMLVLDRPNPAGAAMQQAEGPMLDEINCASFIGRWSIPVKHSCTLGELAVYFAATRLKDLDLQVVKVQGWQRAQPAAEAGWHFVSTSPAIKDAATALLYAGMGLLEGIRVNEGRGTDNAFTLMGAPWIAASSLNKAFIGLQLPGIVSHPVTYTPGWGLYAGEICQGLQFSITDIHTCKPVRTALLLIQLLVSIYPDACTRRLYPTVANPSGEGHLDKLTGVFQSFEKIKRGDLLQVAGDIARWKTIMQPYLLY